MTFVNQQDHRGEQALLREVITMGAISKRSNPTKLSVPEQVTDNGKVPESIPVQAPEVNWSEIFMLLNRVLDPLGCKLCVTPTDLDGLSALGELYLLDMDPMRILMHHVDPWELAYELGVIQVPMLEGETA